MKIIITMLAGTTINVDLTSLTPREITDKIIKQESDWVELSDGNKPVVMVNRKHIVSIS